jgi:legumain
VFVYFADHGATGLVAFPNDELSADDLNAALKDLHANKKYQKLLLYVEACESGSMFDGLLPKDINIYATTAANPDESSYACYWDDDRQTYLGDVYSVNWIEDSDALADLSKETLAAQFNKVKQETNTSHVMQYGDTTISKLTLSEFQGAKKAQFDPHRVKITDAVKASDVPLIRAFRKASLAKTDAERKTLLAKANKIVDGRVFLINQIKKIAGAVSKKVGLNAEDLILNKRKLTQHKCAKVLYYAFDKFCFDISRHTYTMPHLYVLANVCEQINESQVPLAYETIARHCATSRDIHEHNYVIV